METLFSSIPTSAIAWLSFIGFVIMGAIAIFGVFNSRNRDRLKDENATEDRVINLFKEEIMQLTKRVTQQDNDIKNLTVKVDSLEKENIILVKVLQGRDDKTQEFYKDSYIAMNDIKSITGIAKVNNELLQRLLVTLEAYFKQNNVNITMK